MMWLKWLDQDDVAVAPNKSSPLTKRVSCLVFLWRGFNVSFQASMSGPPSDFRPTPGSRWGMSWRGGGRTWQMPRASFQWLVDHHAWPFSETPPSSWSTGGRGGCWSSSRGFCWWGWRRWLLRGPLFLRRNGQVVRAETPFCSRCLRCTGRCSVTPRRREGWRDAICAWWCGWGIGCRGGCSKAPGASVVPTIWYLWWPLGCICWGGYCPRRTKLLLLVGSCRPRRGVRGRRIFQLSIRRGG